jgi:hypothetical protein
MRCLFLNVFFHYSSRAGRTVPALGGEMKNIKGFENRNDLSFICAAG